MLLNEKPNSDSMPHGQRSIVPYKKPISSLCLAAGKPDLVTEDMDLLGVVVVDAGINQVDGKTVGDVDFEGVSKRRRP